MLVLVDVDLLRPTVVEPAIRLALDPLLGDAPRADERRSAIERQLGALDGKIGQLTAAIESGGHLPALLAALETRESERISLLPELRSLATVTPAGPKDRHTPEQRLREKLIDWRGMLTGNVTHALQVLEQVLAE